MLVNLSVKTVTPGGDRPDSFRTLRKVRTQQREMTDREHADLQADIDALLARHGFEVRDER